MGERNYLVEGVSGAGKTTVAVELERRGYQVVHGDRVLSRTGDPVTGRPLEEPTTGWSPEQKHHHHIWDTDQLQTLVADNSHPLTFFCGGSRNSATFIHLFDGVFVLDIDAETLNRRLDARPDEFGNQPEERSLVLRLHRTQEDLPSGGVSIDATRSVTEVVNDILRRVEGSAGTTETAS